MACKRSQRIRLRLVLAYSWKWFLVRAYFTYQCWQGLGLVGFELLVPVSKNQIGIASHLLKLELEPF
jgi:hypothetical protein